MKNSLNEFKPALKFVVIFAGVYFIGNIIYGVFVEYFRPAPDPATVIVSNEVNAIVNAFGGSTESKVLEEEPVVLLKKRNEDTGMSKVVLRVFEGCNGLNVSIVFVAFVVAFGGPVKKMIVFLLSGLVVIHFFNLLRIILLYYTALYQPRLFYYFHKYFFTAVLYCVVFALWIVWTKMKPASGGTVQAQ